MKTPILNRLVDRTKEQVEMAALAGDLDNLVAECEALTRANCGWQQYYLGKIIVDYARYLKALREAALHDGEGTG